jgi:hypothetical protein
MQNPAGQMFQLLRNQNRSILLTKFFGYFLLRQASAIFAQTERDDLLTWSVRLYFSSDGNFFVTSWICVADSNAS